MRRGDRLKDVLDSEPTFPPTLTEKAAVSRLKWKKMKKIMG
jgi:hypothetical protein